MNPSSAMTRVSRPSSGSLRRPSRQRGCQVRPTDRTDRSMTGRSSVSTDSISHPFDEWQAGMRRIPAQAPAPRSRSRSCAKSGRSFSSREPNVRSVWERWRYNGQHRNAVRRSARTLEHTVPEDSKPATTPPPPRPTTTAPILPLKESVGGSRNNPPPPPPKPPPEKG
jgi:hypothetical protein